MSDIVIKVENVSKQYRLGLVGTGSLGHDLNRWWHRVRGKEDPYLKVTEVNDRTKGKAVSGKRKATLPATRLPLTGSAATSSPSPTASRSTLTSEQSSDYVWALKDINFEVKRGEVLGIIGRNGAGKSTLLKLLSRVTGPTTGQIKVKGRVASLLEVGTGFHPELTGRENIYLNGAINGMTRAEVTSKLEEIVDFSGCERYIDTPVKRYSSGMTVRLGFAVAAHLDPEILIVDEVLAVGDAEFQKKCIGKMQDVASHGRTVLFVSHNMGAVSNLCSGAMLINQGQIETKGLTSEIIDYYRIGSVSYNQGLSIPAYRAKWVVNPLIQIVGMDTPVKTGRMLLVGEKIELSFRVCSKMKELPVRVGVTILDSCDMPVGTFFSKREYIIKKNAEIQIPLSTTQKLAPGFYAINVGVFTGDISTQMTNHDVLLRIPAIEIIPKMVEDEQGIAQWHPAWGSVIFD